MSELEEKFGHCRRNNEVVESVALAAIGSVPIGEPRWRSFGSLDAIGRAVTRQRLATEPW